MYICFFLLLLNLHKNAGHGMKYYKPQSKRGQEKGRAVNKGFQEKFITGRAGEQALREAALGLPEQMTQGVPMESGGADKAGRESGRNPWLGRWSRASHSHSGKEGRWRLCVPSRNLTGRDQEREDSVQQSSWVSKVLRCMANLQSGVEQWTVSEGWWTVSPRWRAWVNELHVARCSYHSTSEWEPIWRKWPHDSELSFLFFFFWRCVYLFESHN